MCELYIPILRYKLTVIRTFTQEIMCLVFLALNPFSYFS